MLQFVTRKLSPYEQTQLAKFGIKIDDDFESTYGQMPVEQITGHVEFCGLDFIVNDQVLIPRIESERLVELVAQDLKQMVKKKEGQKNKVQVVEVGTGSGAIVISLAKKFESEAEWVDFIGLEISSAALEVAKDNTNRLLERGAVTLIESNLLSALPDSQRIDLLVANLPYIPTARIESLDESVRNYEPRVALDGGETGFELIAQLIEQAKQKLSEDSVIWLEIDFSHGYDEFAKFNDTWSITIQTDEFSKNRYARLTKKI